MAKPHGPAPCLPSGDVFANTFSSIPRGVSIVIEFLSRAGDASAGPKDSAAASSASTGGAFGGSAGTTGTTRRPETLCSLGGNGEAAASSASAALPVSARAGFHKEVEVASAPQNARYIAVVQDVEEALQGISCLEEVLGALGPEALWPPRGLPLASRVLDSLTAPLWPLAQHAPPPFPPLMTNLVQSNRFRGPTWSQLF